MDDGRLDRIEQALLRHHRLRSAAAAPPPGFSAAVMRGVRQAAERQAGFWDIFGLAARRFAPVGALAATAAYGYAQVMERLLSQAVLSLSLHGGGAATLVRLMP